MDAPFPPVTSALDCAVVWIAIPPDGRAPLAVCSPSRLDLDQLLVSAGLQAADCTIGRGRLAEAEFVMDWDRVDRRVFA